MSKKTLLTNSAGVPFDVYYGGKDHAIVIGKIAQGKSFCTDQVQNIDSASSSINTPERHMIRKQKPKN